MEKYNIALLCKDPVQVSALESISHKLAGVAPSEYILGVSSLVHVTVCRFKARAEDIENIWQRVQNISPDFSLEAKRFYWAPNSGDGIRNFTGIELSKSEELLTFQQKLIEALAPIQIKNPAGFQYFPHFTLGYNDLSQSPNIMTAMQKESAIWQKPFMFKLALGVDGQNGELQELLFSQ